MCDIFDLGKLLSQNKNEEEKAQDDAAAQGLVIGGTFAGFFNPETGERLILDDEEEAEVLNFPHHPDDEGR